MNQNLFIILIDHAWLFSPGIVTILPLFIPFQKSGHETTESLFVSEIFDLRPSNLLCGEFINSSYPSLVVDW